MKLQTLATALMITIVAGQAPAQPAAAADPAKLAEQAQKLEEAGDRAKALAAYRQVIEKAPGHVAAHLGIGRVLDLEGQYVEARRHLQTAIDRAADPEKNQALSTMAVSYAFEGNARDAARYYQQVFDRQVQAGAPDSAGGIANALGRVYLETGDLDNAEKWYRTGYEHGTKAAAPGQKDLAEMRWHHAQARIAARRKQPEAARKHVDEVKAIADRGRLDESQRLQVHHVAGYAAFYQGDFERAIAELAKADQEDPFILSLLAQSYEQRKDQARARELYAAIAKMPDHSLQAALSRPFAQRRLAAK
jgi:Flp pilus assembly protein TadD